MDNTLFVGREAQLEQLNNHWREALQKKQGKVIFLVGEAGIGKTSLVEQFSRRVLKNYSGVQYAYAQCDQVAGDISPYAPFVQILNSLTEQAAKRGDNWFVEYMREVGPDVLGMVPIAGSLLTAAAKSVDFVWQRRKHDRAAAADRGQFGQQELFQQFTDTFRNLAANKNPLLLCIDDWHWADTSSTNLLFHLARQLSDVPLLLLATYRPHDAEARAHPILHIRTEMERYSLCASLELDFLSRIEVESYLTQRFPTVHFTPQFVEWLLQTTSGNALFITEYLNLMINEGRLSPDGQLTGELTDLHPPASVEAVIRTRLSYLDREARDMLAYGSVEGQQFTTLVLSRLLDIKPLSLLRKLRAIEETHHLIASLGQQSVYEQQTTVYRFVHALIYHTLYNMLEAEERIEISRLLLELLDSVYIHSDDPVERGPLVPKLIQLADEVNDYLKVAQYALVVAKAAAQDFAHTEVKKQCDLGLDALSHVASLSLEIQQLQINLLLCRGQAEDFASEWEQSLKTYSQAELMADALQDVQLQLEIFNKKGTILRQLGRYDTALDYHQRAAVLAEQAGNQEQLFSAYYGLGLIYWRLDNYPQLQQCAQKILTVAQTLQKPGLLAQSYNILALYHDRQEDYQTALDYYTQSKIYDEQAEDWKAVAWKYVNIARMNVKQGQLDLASQFFDQGLALCEKLNFGRPKAAVLAGKGTICRIQGDVQQAFFWYEQSLAEIRSSGVLRGAAWTQIEMALAHTELGQYEQALELLHQSLKTWQQLDFRYDAAITAQHIADVYHRQGNYPLAMKWYTETQTCWQSLEIKHRIEETRQRIAAVEAKLAEIQEGRPYG